MPAAVQRRAEGHLTRALSVPTVGTMIRKPRLVRRVLAPWLAALMTSLSVLVPLLDAGERPDGPVVEAEHHAPDCVRGHDHTICLQLGANRALPDARRTGPLPSGGVHGLEVPRRSELPVPDAVYTTRSRAPPLA